MFPPHSFYQDTSFENDSGVSHVPKAWFWRNLVPKLVRGRLCPRFARGLLARSARKWPDFWTFGDTYLYLTRNRVQKSLWNPHQSKAINFLHRNYVPTFFSTPKKKYFFEIKNIFREKKSGQVFFFVDFPENQKKMFEKK